MLTTDSAVWMLYDNARAPWPLDRSDLLKLGSQNCAEGTLADSEGVHPPLSASVDRLGAGERGLRNVGKFRRVELSA